MRQTRVPSRGKWTLAAAVLVLAAAAAGAFAVYRRAQPQPAPAPPPVAAKPEVSLPGRIQAKTVIPIPAPVKGVVEIFHVEVGQEVYEGQLLAQIKSQALEGAKEAAELTAEAMQTKVNNLEYSLTAARLEASRASADAQRAGAEMQRLEKLRALQKVQFEGGALPRNVFEKTDKEFSNARSEAQSLETLSQNAESRVEQIQKDLDTARRLLDEKNHDLEQAKAHLSAGEVFSPANGFVAARRGAPGDQVDPSVRDLFQIATDMSTMELVVEPNPEMLSRIKPGQPALVRVAEVPGEALSGIVTRVETGLVVVEFANPSPEVKPGLTAQVTIKLT